MQDHGVVWNKLTY